MFVGRTAQKCAIVIVNLEVFTRILFSRIELNDIFATLKIRD